MRLALSVFADYHQFHVLDERAEGNHADSWTPQAFARMLAVASGTLAVGTARNIDVPVTVEVLEAEPTAEFSGCDLVNEATLEVTSGTVLVAGCTDYLPDARRFTIPVGRYRVRVAYRGLGTVSPDQLEGQDRYQVTLWRDDRAVEPRTLHDARATPGGGG